MPYYPVSSSNDYDGKLQAYPDMNFVSLMQGNTDGTNLDIGLTNAFESYSAGSQSVSYQPTQPHGTSMRQVMPGGFDKMQESRGNPGWQLDAGCNNLPSRFSEDVNYAEIFNSFETIDQQHGPPAHGNLIADEDGGKPNLEEGLKKPPLLEGFVKEGLKKLDSFERWMSKELGDVNESQTQSTSGTYWDAVETENGVDSIISPQVHLDSFILGPSISQDQLFNIIDFSPNWADARSGIKGVNVKM